MTRREAHFAAMRGAGISRAEARSSLRVMEKAVGLAVLEARVSDEEAEELKVSWKKTYADQMRDEHAIFAAARKDPLLALQKSREMSDRLTQQLEVAKTRLERLRAKN